MKRIYLRPRQSDVLALEIGKSILGEVEFNVCYDDIPSDANILISTFLDEKELERLPKLEAVFVYKTGIEYFPLEILRDRQIHLINSHANANIIAEHALALALCLTHSIVNNHNNLKNGIWQSSQHYFWESISNKNIGILGYGCIGKAIEQLLCGFNCSIGIINRNKPYKNSIKLFSSLDELLLFSDILFIALPQTKDTHHMLNAHNISLLENSFIVNVGRADVIDEKIIFEALKNRSLKGYASDSWNQSKDKNSFDSQVYPSKYPFHLLDNVLLSPHNCTHEVDGHRRYLIDIYNKVNSYLEGKAIDFIDLQKGY